MKRFLIAACCFTAMIAVNAQTPGDTARVMKEEDYYQIRLVPIPDDIQLEVGGMTFLPDDALAVCTRRGEVWKISNPYMKNDNAPRYTLYAQGLHEALGINYVNGELYTTHRSEITRLRDLDGDGQVDEYKTIYSWPLSGNYHEYAYGPIVDKEGNLVVTLNLAWTGKEESQTPWHGWMLKITPDGQMKPYAAGMRSPAAFAANKDGDIFYSENQGGWVGSGYIAHVEEGDFMGNPEGLKWSSLPGSPVKLKASDIPDTGEPKYEVAKRVPGLKTPAVWFPQAILGISTSGILLDNEQGKMGPFDDQLYVGDQGQSKIMRVYLEKVKGVYQGIAFPFREGFNSGVLRLNWGSDGTMFVGQTSRGWGSTGPEKFGLQQLVWNGKLPFEMQQVNAMSDGFEITFTHPVNKKYASDPASYSITHFTYKYGHEYGSPVINQGESPIRALQVSEDGMKVRMVVDSMILGYIHEIKAEGVRSADNYSLLHNYGYYTLNQIPDGAKMTITDANRVKAPMHHHMEPAAEKVQPAKKTTAKAPEKKTRAVQSKHQSKQPSDWNGGPDKTIVMTPVPGLKYNLNEFTVKAGSKVKLTFNNTDDMLHNVVFTLPNSANDVGNAAVNMGLNGSKMHYVPNSPKVLFHTYLLQPGDSDTIYFTVPDEPGDYDYVCTYPGHYIVMRGIMHVVKK